jgi:hypothetical protein
VSATDKALKTTTAPLPANEAPVPQYYSPTNDRYEEHQGEGGAAKVRVEDGHDVATGAKADAAATTDTGTFSLIALTKRLLSQFATWLLTVGTPGSAAPSRVTMLGATDGTNAQALKVDAQKNLLVGLRNSGGGEMVANATGNGHNGSAALRVASSLYNGTSFDFQHANTEGTLLASAARTATTTTPNQTNHNARGVLVTLNISVAGTGGLTVRVWAIDPVSGTQVALDGGSAVAVTATGRYSYMFYPGIVEVTKTGSGLIQQTRSVALPRTWLVQVAHADGSSWTYSVGYALIV